MSALSDALHRAHFVCIADFSDYPHSGTIAAALGDLSTSFDDACDKLIEADAEGREARVFRIDFAASAITDITDDASAAIARWNRQRGIAAE